MKFKPVLYNALLLVVLGGVLWFADYEVRNSIPPYCTPEIALNTLQLSVRPLLTPETVECGGVFIPSIPAFDRPAENRAAVSCLKNALSSNQPFSLYRIQNPTDTVEYNWLVGTAKRKIYEFSASYAYMGQSCAVPISPILVCEQGELETVAPWKLRLTCQSEAVQCPNPMLEISTMDWFLWCDKP